eukprot:TRINITY_DN4468_c0_g1_i1.p1 TRINITY_DN4468_c0_g1~~TRINITY_DN4468_c0_g1_i1.p1  ORF type:complete len:443 (-),score=72.25 TRINITY_DN4468_c0_g1_i1:918-2246(-)
MEKHTLLSICLVVLLLARGTSSVGTSGGSSPIEDSKFSTEGKGGKLHALPDVAQEGEKASGKTVRFSLPPWLIKLVGEDLQQQRLRVEGQLKGFGKAVLDKAETGAASLQGWAKPRIENIQLTVTPAVKQQWEALSKAVKPQVEGLQQRAQEGYAAATDLVSPHVENLVTRSRSVLTGVGPRVHQQWTRLAQTAKPGLATVRARAKESYKKAAEVVSPHLARVANFTNPYVKVVTPAFEKQWESLQLRVQESYTATSKVLAPHVNKVAATTGPFAKVVREKSKAIVTEARAATAKAYAVLEPHYERANGWLLKLKKWQGSPPSPAIKATAATGEELASPVFRAEVAVKLEDSQGLSNQPLKPLDQDAPADDFDSSPRSLGEGLNESFLGREQSGLTAFVWYLTIGLLVGLPLVLCALLSWRSGPSETLEQHQRLLHARRAQS